MQYVAAASDWTHSAPVAPQAARLYKLCLHKPRSRDGSQKDGPSGNPVPGRTKHHHHGTQVPGGQHLLGFKPREDRPSRNPCPGTRLIPPPGTLVPERQSFPGRSPGTREPSLSRTQVPGGQHLLGFKSREDRPSRDPGLGTRLILQSLGPGPGGQFVSGPGLHGFKRLLQIPKERTRQAQI